MRLNLAAIRLPSWVSLLILLAAVLPAGADEGMWTFDQVPLKLLQDRYGFTPTPEFWDHLRLSSVQAYASAAFVSRDGLILTNHHVALGAAQRLSTPERNMVRDGFFAAGTAEEIPIPGMSVLVLLSMKDVTDRVHGAIKPGASSAESNAQQEAAAAAIEAECSRGGGQKGEVISLYGGARHTLQQYREYTDVRLVFIPELQAAFFGGDFDNFTYPRYDLDLAFLRAYEDGKPARVEHFLATETAGSADGDLIFVPGHPGSTDRLKTCAMLEYLGDTVFPETLTRLKGRRDLLNTFSARGAEQARRARTSLYFLENAIKSTEGEYGGLTDRTLMARKRASEEALRAEVRKNPELAGADAGWAGIQSAMEWARAHEKERAFKKELGSRTLLHKALSMVRYAEEVKKPDAGRLPGYHDSELPELLRNIETPSPVYADLEEVLLADELECIQRGLGPGDPFVKALLGGKTPQEVSRSVLSGTKLGEVQFRAGLLKDRGRGLAGSKDPLIMLARAAEPTLRETQQLFRDRVEAVEDAGLTEIARAAFAVYGTGTYPDATGTLRLAFGKVAGYPFATTLVPPFTTYYGLFDRAYSFGNTGDFALPTKIEVARAAIDPRTPLNFVCTADITGGNSGSPVVDRHGKLVGLVFDGNMQSHPNTFVYDEAQARCVAVDIRGILEALRKVYGAGRLADEMVSGGMGKKV